MTPEEHSKELKRLYEIAVEEKNVYAAFEILAQRVAIEEETGKAIKTELN